MIFFGVYKILFYFFVRIHVAVILVYLYLVLPNIYIILYLTESDYFRRLHVIKSILKPAERNLWAKTNIILLLIWHGSGFAFRYTRPPHLENQHVPIQESVEEIVFINMGIG